MSVARTWRVIAAVLVAAVLFAVLLHPGLGAGQLFLPVVLMALMAPALSFEVHEDGPRVRPTSLSSAAAAGRAPPFLSVAA